MAEPYQESKWKVTMLLADAAQAVGNKLYIIGGGWSIILTPTQPTAIAIKIDVPWTEANRAHRLRLALLDEDGQGVRLPGPQGEQALEIGGNFEVGRPPGLRPGTAIDVALAVNVGALPLPANRSFIWKLTIDDQSEDSWELAFSTRSSSLQTGLTPA
jgi:hypothetical protein